MNKNVSFQSHGYTIRGNFSLPFAGAPCVIFSHGLEGSKDGFKWKFFTNSLYDLGIASLRFNYHGCGEGGEKSDGNFEDSAVSKRMADFKAAIDFVEGEPVDNKRLGAIGSSLGGTVIINLHDKRIKALVSLATPFIFQKPSPEEIAKHQHDKYHFLPSGARVKKQFIHELWELDTQAAIKKLACPLIIMHGSNDEVVPVEDARKLYEKANEPKMLKVINGANHSFDDPSHLKQVAILGCGWVKQYL